MKAEINHLEGIETGFVETPRIRMHLLTAGYAGNTPLLFLHGNTSSSTIWEEFMLQFSDEYYCVAPDLRGFGLTDEHKLIDATRGLLDWVEDIVALSETMGLCPFHLVGHSLGGFVCWGLLALYPGLIRSATLFSPGPPVGFGGVHGMEGIPNNEDYSGSGGGIVVEAFAERIREQDRSNDNPMFSPRNVMNRLFWKEGFRAEREQDILSAMLQIHYGEKQYPGDYVKSDFWPGVAPGVFGPVNALSPKYNETVLKQLIEAEPKRRVLWVQGKNDHIISDQSYSDPGYQGKMRLREGWPGEEVYPPQPMESQVRYALDLYADNGGSVRKEMIDDCGHTPFIEKPETAEKLVKTHLSDEKVV
ncbi:MAG: alpha/beta hydrolase [Balneolaceae bacterium]|nr:alpha/beta hydrolase [Balneolaceae bacterium]